MRSLSLPPFPSVFASVLALWLLTAPPPCQAAEPDAPFVPARSLFLQLGTAEAQEVKTAVIGMTWRSNWQRPLLGGRARLYWEVAFGRWETHHEGEPRSAAWVTQVGITPVLRWVADDRDARWFIEAGIGANVLLPIYRSGVKRFSTAFNFGDHAAVGWRIGAEQRDEISLRLQHFSNAGIRHPNPGENFLQLRYAHAF